MFPCQKFPLAGLDPAIHVFAKAAHACFKTWMAGSSPDTGSL